MAKRLRPKVQIGDRFIKVGEAHARTWEVINLRITVDGILHAQLRSTGREGGAMTIAAGVLMDTSFWLVTLVPPPNGSGPFPDKSATPRDEAG